MGEGARVERSVLCADAQVGFVFEVPVDRDIGGDRGAGGIEPHLVLIGVDDRMQLLNGHRGDHLLVIERSGERAVGGVELAKRRTVHLGIELGNLVVHFLFSSLFDDVPGVLVTLDQGGAQRPGLIQSRVRRNGWHAGITPDIEERRTVGAQCVIPGVAELLDGCRR